jgi:hypothetical protein
MKNKKSMKLKSIAILIIAMTLLLTVSVFAESSIHTKQARLPYTKVRGASIVSTSYGKCTVTINNGMPVSGSPRLEGSIKYTYTDRNTNAIYTKEQKFHPYNNPYAIESIKYRPSPAKNYRSFRTEGFHKVSWYDQTWTAYTSVFYQGK